MTFKVITYGLMLLATAIILAAQPRWMAASGSTVAVQSNEVRHDDAVIKKGAGKETVKDCLKQLNRLKPRKPYIVIDRYSNRLYLRTEDMILQEMSCSVGSGGELVDSTSGRRWEFETPSGVFHIDSKLVEPWWRKPDWAFIEENESLPTNEQDRYDSEMMGEYALGFGNGYFIHGTIYERLLGVSVTHGCVRVGAADLRKLYERVSTGTPVYIY